MATATILFAGGGTGGHLYPSLAVAERLGEREAPPPVHFACSNRSLDREILRPEGHAFTPLGVRPLPRMPWQVPGFLWHYVRSRGEAARLICSADVRVVVAMGGFVSGPVVAAARRQRVPVILVNLDAVAGVANRWLAKRCDRVLSVYENPTGLSDTDRTICMPIRRAAIGPSDPAEARRQLGLEPERSVLLVTGASQGATSINRVMTELTLRDAFQSAARDWQILHLSGEQQVGEVKEAYRGAGLNARVMSFCDQMGLAWSAADLAVSRAGASSVWEAAANRVPVIFMPYPHHRDAHQKRNAQPLVDRGGALLVEDLVEPAANAHRLEGVLIEMMSHPERRQRMREVLAGCWRDDGAAVVAEEAMRLV